MFSFHSCSSCFCSHTVSEKILTVALHLVPRGNSGVNNTPYNTAVEPKNNKNKCRLKLASVLVPGVAWIQRRQPVPAVGFVVFCRDVSQAGGGKASPLPESPEPHDAAVGHHGQLDWIVGWDTRRGPEHAERGRKSSNDNDNVNKRNAHAKRERKHNAEQIFDETEHATVRTLMNTESLKKAEHI